MVANIYLIGFGTYFERDTRTKERGDIAEGAANDARYKDSYMFLSSKPWSFFEEQ